MTFVELKPFAPSLARMQAQAERTATGLAFAYRAPFVSASTAPPARQGDRERRNELWKSTCFEAFFAIEGDPSYWEANFAPAGGWNVYGFASCREGMRLEAGALEVRASASDGEWRFEASFGPDLIAATSGRLEVGLTAVIAAPSGELSYWALTHPEEKPDFHARSGWIARLAPRKG